MPAYLPICLLICWSVGLFVYLCNRKKKSSSCCWIRSELESRREKSELPKKVHQSVNKIDPSRRIVSQCENRNYINRRICAFRNVSCSRTQHFLRLPSFSENINDVIFRFVSGMHQLRFQLKIRIRIIKKKYADVK